MCNKQNLSAGIDSGLVLVSAFFDVSLSPCETIQFNPTYQTSNMLTVPVMKTRGLPIPLFLISASFWSKNSLDIHSQKNWQFAGSANLHADCCRLAGSSYNISWTTLYEIG